MIKVNTLGPNYQSLEEFEFVCHATPAEYFGPILEVHFFALRACPYMSTYRFGTSETRYLVCHNNIIIWGICDVLL